MIFSIISAVTSVFTSSYTAISSLVTSYGYAAIFGLMLLEGSSLPVPSEVVMPLAGLFAHQHLLRFYPALIAGLLGSIGGLAIDYYIGYLLGKDVVYRHLRMFHISKESLDRFDAWFARNGSAAVFISRLVPVARTFMSFPAGFAKMNAKRFFTYSIAGTFIWDAVLMAYGYYLLSAKSAVVVLFGIAAFAVVVYLIYYLFRRHTKRQH
ncbi:MAG: DedA family protein [Candidatus Marsarchaeota archaeon]|nr:DedA family protein [Candidatus Marsarchaeota archaeon]